MNEIRRPTKWDTKSKRTSRRITRRLKDTILHEYSEAMTRGKNRDDILDKLAKKYGKSCRAIERYIHDAREAQKKVETAKTLQTVSQGLEIALARSKHWDDLASLAAEFVSFWEDYNIGHPIGGYYGYVIDDPLMIELPAGLAHCLLCHLKFEFSEFKDIDHWEDLLKIDTPREVIEKLALIAHRRTFQGTCHICQGWS